MTPNDSGLERGTVRSAPHSPRWSTRFAELATALVASLAEDCSAVEHVGSTAVANLLAKPIIDIAVLLSAGHQAKRVAEALSALGYEDRGDKGREGGHLFVLEDRPNHGVVHLHVVSEGDPQWDAYLSFAIACAATNGPAPRMHR